MCDLFLFFSAGFSGKVKNEESTERTNKTVYGRDTPGPENYAGNALL